MQKEIIQFIRQKDYQYIEDLGQGACGKTVLLYDDVIEEHFVCKKYSPIFSEMKEELFSKFVQEIKLLHSLNHQNIVRVFNYFIYPNSHSGFILMEHINGVTIEKYVANSPESLSSIFIQTLAGFQHLETQRILHRDIRPANIMVTNLGIVKIIDFGFGKKTATVPDFDKSITLNWWCVPPDEFNHGIYDYSTEVYFVGMLFERLIRENNIHHFPFMNELKKMCAHSSQQRYKTFAEVDLGNTSTINITIQFTDDEKSTYRRFSDNLADSFSQIESKATYVTASEKIESTLNELYIGMMLEEYVPNIASLTRSFINGTYYYNKSKYFEVSTLKEFLDLLKSCSKEKKNIIVRNLHSKLDGIPRYDKNVADDIPF